VWQAGIEVIGVLSLWRGTKYSKNDSESDLLLWTCAAKRATKNPGSTLGRNSKTLEIVGVRNQESQVF